VVLSILSPKIRFLDLIRSHFDWNSEEGGESESPQHTYSVVVTSHHPSLFYCDISIRRQGGRHSNFNISASYFCSTHQSAEDDLAHAMIYHKAVAESAIWSKFSEWAIFTLNQGDIMNIKLPVFPETVITRQLQS
jgi:hypothetical protein